jgi:hypothetical protein
VRTLPLVSWAVPGSWRNRRAPQGPALLVLSGLCLLFTVLFLEVSPSFFTPGYQILCLLAGGLLLDTRTLRLLLAVAATCLVTELALRGFDEVRPGGLIVVAVTAFACYEFARSREETGLGAFGGENVLLELRERLEQQGRLPQLPLGWGTDSVVRPAGDVPFAGDFVVSALHGPLLEIALVDVSGKGVEAGTRSLLLSGALGGLLGSASPSVFLRRSNHYLVRQDWEEGFATAVHVAIDLSSGAYEVGSAGHPPVAHFDGGTGRWRLHDAPGVALGLLADEEYPSLSGTLDRGDALLLYTDGLVEVPGRDLAYGIDKLLGHAERSVADGFVGGAGELVTRVGASSADDRGLVLLWRAG